jgi:anti-sigma factor RsiW
MSSCEETEELLPEFVLGVLEADATARVVEHLAHCAMHVASLEAYQAVCDGLGANVPLVEPPARLKNRLLSSLSSRRSAPRRGVGWARLGWAVAALATALALVFGAWALSLQNTASRRASRAAEFQALVSQPDSRMVPLVTSPDGGTAKGVLILSSSQAGVWAVGLSALSGEQVYECWWVDSTGGWESGGMFRPEGDAAVWIIERPLDLQAYRSFQITREPDARDHAPQGPEVMEVEF